MNFKAGTDTFYIPIPPEMYLLEESVMGETACFSMLTYDARETAAFILGIPFFRATTIQLNYNTSDITVYLDTKEDSPIIPAWPEEDKSVAYLETLSVNEGFNYTGAVYVSEDFTYSSGILFDTGSRLSIMLDSWLDAASDPSITIDNSNTFTYTLDGQTFGCTMAYSYICGFNS